MAENKGRSSLGQIGKGFRSFLKFREAMLIFIVIGFMLIISIMSPNFLTADNIRSLLVGLALDGITVIGMAYAIITAGLDLSIGSVLALSGVVTGKLFVMGVNIWLAALIGIFVAVLCGALSGFLIGKVGLNSFITTLGVSGIARGICFVITEGTPIPLINKLPESFKFIGGGKLKGIPVIVIIAFAILIIGDLLLRRSASMRKIYYTGSNEKAAMLSGINVVKVKIGVYVISALLAGIAGVLADARFGVATPIIGGETAMVLISAAVIGGCSFSGGEGSVFGAIIGIFLLSLVTNALILLNISIYWQQLVTGLILVLAITLDHLRNKRLEQSMLRLRKI
ncbi:MAG: ABC transporter permease [Actinomycetota bacterium]|nr:ABC transporter permease [Actinomycetota bacterium]